MSENVGHPDAVGDESGALDSEPALILDEDRLGEDPLEGGMDTAEDYSRQVKLGGTRASEEQDTLAYRIPQEEPDPVLEEIEAEPGRPLAATPVDDLDESVDAPEHGVDGVDGMTDAAMVDPLTPDGGTEAELEGEVELGASSGPEQQALRIEQET